MLIVFKSLKCFLNKVDGMIEIFIYYFLLIVQYKKGYYLLMLGINGMKINVYFIELILKLYYVND